MERTELLMVRALIDAFLALPEDLRAEVSRLLASGSPKPNGHDPHPPAPTPKPKVASKPHAAKPYDNPAHARAAERKLLAAMREHPGLSAASLAKVVGAGLSTTKERLRRMGRQDLIEKAPDGRWQVRAEEPRLPAQSEEARPTSPPSN